MHVQLSFKPILRTHSSWLGWPNNRALLLVAGNAFPKFRFNFWASSWFPNNSFLFW
jgi:hypothetical protein